MTTRRVQAVAGAAMLLVLAAAWPANRLDAATPLLPNLKAQPASQLRIETTPAGSFLRFSTTTWNAGTGPVELIGGSTDSSTRKQQVTQRIFNSDGSYADHVAGAFEWHPEHAHIHFDDYALYTLQPVDAPGGSSRTGSKTTFCIIDTTKMPRVAGAPKRPVYTTCGQFQGMSAGWGDTYGYWLPGQEMDITGLPDGDYRLSIVADWKNRIIESNDADNTSAVDLRFSDGAVEVIGGRRGHGNGR